MGEDTNATTAAAAKMEPEIAALDFLPSLGEAATVSIAISLKRLADALTGNGVEALLDKIANHPMNAYGEGFSSAIQEALVRGQKGVSLYDR